VQRTETVIDQKGRADLFAWLPVHQATLPRAARVAVWHVVGLLVSLVHSMDMGSVSLRGGANF